MLFTSDSPANSTSSRCSCCGPFRSCHLIYPGHNTAGCGSHGAPVGGTSTLNGTRGAGLHGAKRPMPLRASSLLGRSPSESSLHPGEVRTVGGRTWLIGRIFCEELERPRICNAFFWEGGGADMYELGWHHGGIVHDATSPSSCVRRGSAKALGQMGSKVDIGLLPRRYCARCPAVCCPGMEHLRSQCKIWSLT